MSKVKAIQKGYTLWLGYSFRQSMDSIFHECERLIVKLVSNHLRIIKAR